MHFLCTICSDIVNHAENIISTKCGHVFHHHCLTQWIERSKSCPQCRAKVTDKCMFRLFFTISKDITIDDAATLQAKLDDTHLQMRQVAASIKEKEDKIAAVTIALEKNEEALKAAQNRVASRDSSITALKEQLLYATLKSKETAKLEEENEKLKRNLQLLNGLQKVLNATTDDVEQMVRDLTDVKAIATYATALKRALCESESKKSEYRDRLQASERQLNIEKKKCSDWQAKYIEAKENLKESREKLESLSKRKASEASLNHSLTEESWNKALKVQNQSDTATSDDSASDNSLRVKGPYLDDRIDTSNTSINTMVNKIENADSPYLNLKQSSLALTALQHRPTTSDFEVSRLKPTEFAFKRMGQENVANGHYIFSKKKTEVLLSSDKKPKNDLDISYDGLGGHSKLDVFPVPHKAVTALKPRFGLSKLSAKHKLKRP